jgi:anti-sigma B factor antagonist
VNLSIKTETRKDPENVPLIMHVEGDLDIYTAPQLKEALSEAGLKSLILDLSGVHFIDSTALGVLVAALQQTRANGGELRLVMDDPYLLKIFRITGFDGLFSIFPQVAHALDAA